MHNSVKYSLELWEKRYFNFRYLHHGTITWNNMEENPLLNVRLNCRWCIVENAKIFWSYVKNFWNLPWVRNEGPRLLNTNKFSSIFQSNFLTTTNLPIKLLDNHQSSNQTSWQPSIFQSNFLATINLPVKLLGNHQSSNLQI